jgi:hypothetical protein
LTSGFEVEPSYQPETIVVNIRKVDGGIRGCESSYQGGNDQS